jgi:hypothetical protein
MFEAITSKKPSKNVEKIMLPTAEAIILMVVSFYSQELKELSSF